MEECLGWLRLALEAPGEPDPTDRAFAESFVFLGDVRDTRADGPDVERALAEAAARLEAADATRRPLAALMRPLLVSLGGDRERGEHLFDEVLRHPDPWLQAAAPLVRAQLAENEGDVDRMRGELARALAAFRTVGDRWGLSMTLLSRAGVHMLDGELDAAAVALDEARALSAELGARVQDAMLGLRLVELRLRRGDVAGARDRLDELAARRDLGAEEALIVRAMRLRVAVATGERAHGRALRADVAARLEQTAMGGHDRGHARAIANAALACSWLDDGDFEAADRALSAAHAAAVASTDMPIVATVGVVCASLAQRLGDAAGAAELLGAAARLRGAEDSTNPEIATLVAKLRANLGDAGFEAAHALGRGADRAAAIARLRPPSRPLDPPGVRPQRKRDEDREQDRHPRERPQQVRAERPAEEQASLRPDQLRERVDVHEGLQPAGHRLGRHEGAAAEAQRKDEQQHDPLHGA
jgi:hypothetical protein